MSAKIYGYLRVSQPSQTQSFDRVREQMEKRITALQAGGVKLGFIIQEQESAVNCRYQDRPGFAQIMKVINPGDHLLVEAKDRLDRDPVAMLNCLQWLERRQVILHCLGVSDQALDLSSYETKMMNHLDAMSSAHYIHWLKQRTKEALQYRKQNGFTYGPNRWGRKSVTLPTKNKWGKPYKACVWDEKQCEIIRRIKRLHDEGMSLLSIGKLLDSEGLRTQRGYRWAKKLPRKKIWNALPVVGVYHWYCTLLASGKDLGDVDVPTPIPISPSSDVVGQPACAAPLSPLAKKVFVPQPPRPRKPPPPPKPKKEWKGKPWMKQLVKRWREEREERNGKTTSSNHQGEVS